MKNVGGRIEELLKEKNMTQRELAERSCTSDAAISHYIKGDRTPNSSTLSNIATVLGTTSSFLLGDESNVTTFAETKRILARNAANLTKEEKLELISLLMS